MSSKIQNLLVSPLPPKNYFYFLLLVFFFFVFLFFHEWDILSCSYAHFTYFVVDNWIFWIFVCGNSMKQIPPLQWIVVSRWELQSSICLATFPNYLYKDYILVTSGSWNLCSIHYLCGQPVIACIQQENGQGWWWKFCLFQVLSKMSLRKPLLFVGVETRANICAGLCDLPGKLKHTNLNFEG